MGTKLAILLRVRIAFLGVLLFGIAVVFRALYIQYWTGDKWRRMAEEITLRYMTVPATRGNIYTDNGGLLATSLPFYRVVIDPTIPSKELLTEKIDSFVTLLGRQYNRDPEEYKQAILNARVEGVQYLVLDRDKIGYQTKKKMMNWPLIRDGRLKGGIIFEQVDIRYRPFGEMAKRTIGFLNENRAGAGLELSYNGVLSGQDGKALFTKIAGNNWRPLHNESEIRPEEGFDIQTTIDVNLQDVAQEALHRHLIAHDAKYGCVLLMEVATGQIKAIANLGRQPNGEFIEDYNYAVGNQGRTDPGSTFKLASMMALFEDKKLNLSDTVETGKGKYKFYDRVMTDSRAGGYGKLSILDVFAKSSNIGVSKLIVDHFGSNPKKYRDYMKTFGLDVSLDFQMKGAAEPYIKTPGDSLWSGVTLPWMSIGYEMKMSPLQTLTFYNAVANGGKLITPIIIKNIWKADRIVENYESKVLSDKICSDETLDKLHFMLEAVVDHGTARNIKTDKYKIAGKTGTAQIIKNGVYTPSYYTSFAGYFPADKPKYSCIVVINNPQGYLQYGSDVAAPVFREIADKIYAQDMEMYRKIDKLPIVSKKMNFPFVRAGYVADLKYLCDAMGVSNHMTTTDEVWASAVPVNKAIMWQKRKVTNGVVANVAGMTKKDAMFLLGNQGLIVKVSGRGRVVHQSISPGSGYFKGATIFLTLN